VRPIIHWTGGLFSLTPPLFHTSSRPNLSSPSKLEEPGWLRRREPSLRRAAEEVGMLEEGGEREFGRGGR